MVLNIVLGLCAVIICQLIFLAYKSMARPCNFPPGPRGVPFLGSLHYLKTYPERDMLELSKKYGDVFSLKFGNECFVCVCGIDANKEVLLHEDICDRRMIYLFKMVKGDAPTGIVHNALGPTLKANRRILEEYVTGKTLAKNSPEKVVDREIWKLMTELEGLADDGELMSVPGIVESLAFEMILGYAFGSKTSRTEEEKAEISELLEAVVAIPRLYLEKATQYPVLFPILQKFWLPGPSKNFIEASNVVVNYIEKQLELHKESFNADNPRDFLDWYLINIELEKKQSEESESVLSEHDLKMIIYDLFIASFVSPAIALAFAVLYLSANPNVQEKLFKETEMVLREEDSPWERRKKMPYALATTYEVLRFSNLAPTGVPRKARQDLTFKGYSIPKNTVFLLNSYSVHIQEDQWKNAHEFDPENFLTEEGEFQEHEGFQTFGDGVRKCPGNSLVKRLVFTFLVSFVKKFKVKPESNDEPPDLNPLPGLVPKPKPQKLKLEKRSEYGKEDAEAVSEI